MPDDNKCPYCLLVLEEEERLNGQVVLGCPNCNYYKETGKLAPAQYNDRGSYNDN